MVPRVPHAPALPFLLLYKQPFSLWQNVISSPQLLRCSLELLSIPFISNPFHFHTLPRKVFWPIFKSSFEGVLTVLSAAFNTAAHLDISPISLTFSPPILLLWLQEASSRSSRLVLLDNVPKASVLHSPSFFIVFLSIFPVSTLTICSSVWPDLSVPRVAWHSWALAHPTSEYLQNSNISSGKVLMLHNCAQTL